MQLGCPGAGSIDLRTERLQVPVPVEGETFLLSLTQCSALSVWSAGRDEALWFRSAFRSDSYPRRAPTERGPAGVGGGGGGVIKQHQKQNRCLHFH